MKKEKCSFGAGIAIRPDGVHELDPCVYELAERHTNVTVEIWRCKNCGDISVEWHRTPKTEDEILIDIGDD